MGEHPRSQSLNERQRWEDSAAAWGRWAEPLAEPADRINRPLIELTDIQAGQRVLDVATGAGEPALTMAGIVGPDGLTVGTDLVPAMLMHSGRRARSRDVSLPLAGADMQMLPFADNTFDRAVCRFGIMFVPDAVAALAEIRRVLRFGGRIGLAVWGALANNTLFREILNVLDEQLGADADGSLTPLFRFSSEGSLSSLLRNAGFSETEELPIHLVQRVPASRPFWQATLEMAFTPRLNRLAPERRSKVIGAVGRHFEKLAGPDGLVEVELNVRLVRGTID